MTAAPSVYRCRMMVAPQESRGDLVLSIGEFIFDETGIVARFNAPLEKLSRHYDWSLVPLGLAAIATVVDEVLTGRDELTDLIIRTFHLSEAVTAPIAKAFGKVEWSIGPDHEEEVVYEASFIDDATQLVQWGSKMARHCPDFDAARMLERLPTFDAGQLRYYVGTSLGW